MSIGFCGYADLIDADDALVMYTYCCYNLNVLDYKRFMKKEDGEFYITRCSLVEPEIHERIKKRPSGKKVRVLKRVKSDFSIEELLATGTIKVKNASGTWETTESGVDILALRILYKLFNEYQEKGELPKHISYFC